MVELMVDAVGSLSKGFLHSAVPVGLDKVLQIAAIGRTGIGNICINCEYMKLLDSEVRHTMVGKPSLELSFVPFVVNY